MPGTTTQFQGGYTNHFRLLGSSLSYSASIARQNDVLTGKPDNRVQAGFSLPLGHTLHSPMLATSFTQDTTAGVRTRGGQEVFCRLGGRGTASSATAFRPARPPAIALTRPAASTADGADASVSASVERGQRGYSQPVDQCATGGLVVHQRRHLANQMADTIGVVEALGAEGARVTNNIGTSINRSGHAGAAVPDTLPIEYGET